MITREQLDELRDGDTVELTRNGKTFVGPVSIGDGVIKFTDMTLAWGGFVPPSSAAQRYDLTVIRRAPKPLYVNHRRVHPVPGDVVRGPEEPGVEPGTWTYTFGGWVSTRSGNRLCPVPRPARLLVDGKTGQVIP